MGTNYFHYDKDACKECGRDYKRRHIGKSSYGWCFSLHVYPDEFISTWDEWKVLLQTGFIKNEYDELISLKEMIDTVENRSHPTAHKDKNFNWAENNAIPGPNNLARHQLLKDHCIGNGEGTWDYIIGYFS